MLLQTPSPSADPPTPTTDMTDSTSDSTTDSHTTNAADSASDKTDSELDSDRSCPADGSGCVEGLKGGGSGKGEGPVSMVSGPILLAALRGYLVLSSPR